MPARADSTAVRPERLVRELLAAFNAHDPARMIALCADDVRWMSVDGDKISIETTGTKQLAESMAGYFKKLPSARSKLGRVTVSGGFVTAVERASWVSKGVTRAQCSVSVYEIRENKIRNVWYFPAHGC